MTTPFCQRLDHLADHVVTLYELGERATPADVEEMSDELADLLDAAFVESVPGARRLMSLIEQRGWTGWTKNKRLR